MRKTRSNCLMISFLWRGRGINISARMAAFRRAPDVFPLLVRDGQHRGHGNGADAPLRLVVAAGTVGELLCPLRRGFQRQLRHDLPCYIRVPPTSSSDYGGGCQVRASRQEASRRRHLLRSDQDQLAVPDPNPAHACPRIPGGLSCSLVVGAVAQQGGGIRCRGHASAGLERDPRLYQYGRPHHQNQSGSQTQTGITRPV